jgi:energy-coupling factor transport system ATP-binding protein
MGIEFKDVNYHYTAASSQVYQALSNIDLSINEHGEFITLIGETGSGKSTLVQHMNALLTPSEGTVRIFGLDINQETLKKKRFKRNPIRQKVGLVFQFPEYQLFEETVEKDIMFGPRNFGMNEMDAKHKAAEMLKVVGLDESYLQRSPFSLSGGEKKRVSIAGILAMEPNILILDEPTSGLDPQGRDDLLKVFYDIHTRLKKTVIIITHDMNTVYQYANRVIVMQQGECVFDGAPMALFTTENVKKWQLDAPDIIKLAQALEVHFAQKMDVYPANLEALVAWVKEVRS